MRLEFQFRGVPESRLCLMPSKSFDWNAVDSKNFCGGLVRFDLSSSLFVISLCVVSCAFLKSSADQAVAQIESANNRSEPASSTAEDQHYQVFWREWLDQTVFEFPRLHDKLFKKSIDRCPDGYVVEYSENPEKLTVTTTFTRNGFQPFELKARAIDSFVIHNGNLYCLSIPIGSNLLHRCAYDLSSGTELWKRPVIYHHVAHRNDERGELRLTTAKQVPEAVGKQAVVMLFSCNWTDYIEIFNPKTGETLAKKVVRDGGKGLPALHRKKD